MHQAAWMSLSYATIGCVYLSKEASSSYSNGDIVTAKRNIVFGETQVLPFISLLGTGNFCITIDAWFIQVGFTMIY